MSAIGHERGCRVIGAFVIDGSAGQALLETSGFVEVGVQVEWSRASGTIPPMSDAGFGTAGFTVRRGVFGTDAVVCARAESDRLFDDTRLTRPESGRTRARGSLSGESVIDRLDPVCDVSLLFEQWAHGDALLDFAAALLGEPTLLFKDKIIAKPPGTAGYGLHQDYMRWQGFTPEADEMVTFGVCLDHATRLSGAVEVYVGQHDQLLTPPGEVADPAPDAVDASRTQLVELGPGDVLAMHPLLPHRSDYNRSRRQRRMLYLTYAAARLGDLRPAYYAAHAELFGDILGPDAPTTS